MVTSVSKLNNKNNNSTFYIKSSIEIKILSKHFNILFLRNPTKNYSSNLPFKFAIISENRLVRLSNSSQVQVIRINEMGILKKM